MYKVWKDGQSAFLQVNFLFRRMMHCVQVRAIMKEKKKRKTKSLLLPIYFKCAFYKYLYILWFMLIHLQLSYAELEIGNNVKCRIRTKTNNTQKMWERMTFIECLTAACGPGLCWNKTRAASCALWNALYRSTDAGQSAREGEIGQFS